MSEDTTTADAAETTTTTETETVEERVPYERFASANKKAREANERATQLEKRLAQLEADAAERESASLPELERERKAREKLEQQLADADKRATEAEQHVQRSQRERWVTTAAQAANFADPSDASAFLDLGEIEDEKDAERAVKRLATKKQHLLRSEDPKLPGRVLADGRPATGATTATGGIDPNGEAQMLADGLKQFLKNR